MKVFIEHVKLVLANNIDTSLHHAKQFRTNHSLYKMHSVAILLLCALVGISNATCDCDKTDRLRIVNIVPIIVNDTFVESESLMLNRTNNWLHKEMEIIKCIVSRNPYYAPISMKSSRYSGHPDAQYSDSKLDEVPTAWVHYYDDDSDKDERDSRYSLTYGLVYKFWLCTVNDTLLSNPNIDPGYKAGDKELKPIAFNHASALSVDHVWIFIGYILVGSVMTCA